MKTTYVGKSLRDTDLRNADLTNESLFEVDLTGANLRGASITLQCSTFDGAVFDQYQVATMLLLLALANVPDHWKAALTTAAIDIAGQRTVERLSRAMQIEGGYSE